MSVDLGGYVIVLVERNGKIKLYGSPAERSDCDEILEINGRSLEEASHQQIIQYIHQCIRTRTICLRVKRRTSGKLAIDASLVDAFVIGSRAREHLQQIARDSNITPRDIAQLSRILSEPQETGSRHLLTTTAIVQKNSQEPEAAQSSDLTEESSAQKSKTIKEKEGEPENSDGHPVTDQRPHRSDSAEGHIEYFELNDENMELVELTRNLNSTGRPQESFQQHRELPVDVPDSFVGIIKQTPRYPPPPPPLPPPSQPQSQPQPQQRTAIQSSLESDKLRKYSEEVNRKKAEEEFLRSSLRGSKRLQQLEQQKVQAEDADQEPRDELMSQVNDAFEPDQEDEDENAVPEQNKVLPLPDLKAILQRLAQNLNDDVKECITGSNLSKLIAIYTSVMQQKQRQHSLPSVSAPSSDLVQEIITLLQEESSLNSEAAELLEILTRFELEGLCYAFDHVVVSEKDSSPLPFHADTDPLNDARNEVQVQQEMLDSSVRVVRIEKSSCEPLGATVRNEPDGSVIIGRIVKGGAAEKSGLLHEGDEVLEVNGIEMKGRNVNQVCDLLAEMTGTLTFVIAIRDAIKSLTSQLQQVVHLKALFDYDPDDDLYIPCRELGICFSKGDILHVIDQQDPNWWQAYREGEHDQSLAGLIPSIYFQLQREAMKQSILSDSNSTAAMNYKNRNHKKTSASSILLNCGKRSHHRRKKRKSQNILPASDEILTFEEVSLYYPRANIKRPIVLIGPTNIGRHELRQRLMQDTERFAAAVPHTSRSRRDGEIDGIDYHFISRQQFEQDIKDGKFVEHGEYEKNYYGTSLGAIEAVVQSGKICVLNLHVHSIPILRQGHAGAKLKPYFVFVAPPPQMDKLNRLISSTATTQQESTNVSSTELQSIIDEARDIENRYGHYFDMILSITDIDRAYQELLREINALEREPQWIPNIWMK